MAKLPPITDDEGELTAWAIGITSAYARAIVSSDSARLKQIRGLFRGDSGYGPIKSYCDDLDASRSLAFAHARE